MPAVDHDLQLKLRLKRMFFSLGYFCPIEVEMSSYNLDNGIYTRKSLTDLDVLAIKYDEMLSSTKIVCDCKTGKVSDPNRLFWLRGVSDFFGADEAYYVNQKINNQARSIAPRMGLRILDSNELQEMEVRLEVAKNPIPLDNISFDASIRALWGIGLIQNGSLTAEQLMKKKLYSYLSYDYWYLEMYRNLFTLIHHFSTVAHLLKEDNPSDVLLAYSGLERFAHCLLEMCSFIYSTGTSRIVESTRVYLYGGRTLLHEREKLFEALKQINLFDNTLDPAYMPEIFEINSRIIRNPHGASKALPYIAAVYYWYVRMGNKDLTPVFGAPPRLETVVLIEDMCSTFAKITGLHPGLFTHIYAL